MPSNNKVQKYFLNKVNLNGYKSIKNVEVEFNDGLNIIIGKNASGKTNFLSFLNNVLSFDFKEIQKSNDSFFSNIFFTGQDKIEIKFKGEINHSEVFSYINKTELFINNKEIDIHTKNIENILPTYNFDFINIFVRHGIPSYYLISDKPFSFIVKENGISTDLANHSMDINQAYFIKSFFAHIYFSLQKEKNNINNSKIQKIIIEEFNKIIPIKYLNKYSPIQDVKLNEDFNISKLTDKQSYAITNLLFRFKIAGNWYPFSSLSDGTKRLFYIISEIACSCNLKTSNNSFEIKPENTNKIILIEEPELGVHPHQLMLLMNFFKEIAETKQVIISTHSPLVLDVIATKEDLERIIIAKIDDANEGTKLTHLNNEEKNSALKYIEEEAYLSDYWIYSDLEK